MLEFHGSHGKLLRLECLQGAKLKEKKNLYRVVLVYKSALNGSIPEAEENPSCSSAADPG